MSSYPVSLLELPWAALLIQCFERVALASTYEIVTIYQKVFEILLKY